MSAKSKAVATEPDVELSEADRREIEEANKIINEGAEVPITGTMLVPPEPSDAEEQEDPAILALRGAFKQIEDKVEWHQAMIEDHKLSIEKHEGKIAELQRMVREKFGFAVSASAASSPASRTKRKYTKKEASESSEKTDKRGSKTRTTYGEGNSTGDLIAACLKKARKPINTATLVEYLTAHDNKTNPSVEVSRMCKKGLVKRSSRGLYEWIGS